VTLRSGIAAAITVMLAPGLFKKLRKLPLYELRLLVFRAALMYGISVPCFVLAVSEGHLGIVSLIAALPFVTFWGVVMYGERPSRLYWLGLVVAVFGLIPMIGSDGGIGLRQAGLAALSSITFALALVLRRSHRADLGDAEMNSVLLILGTVCSAIGAIATNEEVRFNDPIALLLNVAGGGLVALNAYLASVGFVRTSASTAGAVLMLEPIFSAVLGFLIFGQGITLLQLSGAGIMLTGILLPLLLSSFRLPAAGSVGRTPLWKGAWRRSWLHRLWYAWN
jgi:drug/metabolite transporter (DMT)-like permease